MKASTQVAMVFAAATVLIAQSAQAQPSETAKPGGASPPAGETVTEELIRYLKARDALSADEAEHLIQRLRAERPAAPPPVAAQPKDDGTIHVPYLSETQRKKITGEVKDEMIATAKQEHWAQPNAFPEWLNRFSFAGDFRFRYEWDLFDRDNSTQFINFQAINSGNPYDVNLSNGVLPPLLNTSEDRQLPRIRARLDIGAKVADDLSANFRFTTGNNTNPVSTNQTLGTDFNKTSFVVDRAYLDYHPRSDVQVWLGRMPSPWQASTDLVWDGDLNFDGVAGRYQGPNWFGLEPFATAGVFSVENTAFDFPSNELAKGASRDKWLFALQLGFDTHNDSGLSVKEALAYYYFYHLEGRTSSPCYATSTADACDTDDTRPGFIQKGNTLYALRDLYLTSSNLNGPQYQYFGLASSFRVLDLSLQADQRLSGPLHLVFSAESAINLAYNRDAVAARVPVNNYGAGGGYQGGNLGGQLQLLVGYPQIVERWQWNALGGYRRVESDAVVDAFTDSDFHLGGTNAKGFYLGGALGFTHDAWLSLRWLSATEVSGPPLAVDTLQVDVNARF